MRAVYRAHMGKSPVFLSRHWGTNAFVVVEVLVVGHELHSTGQRSRARTLAASLLAQNPPPPTAADFLALCA